MPVEIGELKLCEYIIGSIDWATMVFVKLVSSCYHAYVDKCGLQRESLATCFCFEVHYLWFVVGMKLNKSRVRASRFVDFFRL